MFRKTDGNSKIWDETSSVKAKDKSVLYIKTLDLTVDLNDIFTEI